jgi:hypothetical protein
MIFIDDWGQLGELILTFWEFNLMLWVGGIFEK